MIRRTSLRILTICLFLGSSVFAQQERHDTGSIQEYKNEFYDQIKEETKNFSEEKKDPKMVFKMDFSGIELPDTAQRPKWPSDGLEQIRLVRDLLAKAPAPTPPRFNYAHLDQLNDHFGL